MVNGNCVAIWCIICWLGYLGPLTQASCSSLASYLLCELNSFPALMQDDPGHSFGCCYMETKLPGWGPSVALTQLQAGPRSWSSVTHHESPFLLSCLEAPVAKLGSGINEFEFNGFLRAAACVHQKGLEKKSHSASG